MAIDPKELRIGCHINSDFGMVKVYSLPLKKYDHMPASEIQVRTVNDDSAVIGFDTDFDPIPITPELLTELGFECRDNTYWERWFLGGFDIERKENSKYFDYNSEIRLEYLHELESLYYMIYGIELIND